MKKEKIIFENGAIIRVGTKIQFEDWGEIKTGIVRKIDEPYIHVSVNGWCIPLNIKRNRIIMIF
ncbi:hypothetical protein [Clostridium perfringens]|uniref:hypothetical protein n=1 Tax=Clostridium perfringens TaxID=1502 RepID=UPI0024BC8C08|nr:hypothetical protein [Clostridium perfringens]